MFGTFGPTFPLRKNPFLKHNNSSNRSKTKTPIIANSWNYHICEAPRTTASFPQEARKIRSHSVDEFGPFLQCWDFSKNFRSWQADVWDSGTRLVCCVDSYTICLQSAIIPLCVWLLAIDFFPRYDARLLRWLVVELCRFFAACVPIYY